MIIGGNCFKVVNKCGDFDDEMEILLLMKELNVKPKKQIRSERDIRARGIRERLINEMSTEEKIQIMFTAFIRSMRSEDVIKIGDEFLT